MNPLVWLVMWTVAHHCIGLLWLSLLGLSGERWG